MAGSPPTAKREQVQAAVLHAMEALLAEGATFADLNIEKIATRAGISRTAFYFYFKDKRELLMRLTEDVTGILYEQADHWFSGEGDPSEQLREAIGNIALVYESHAVLLRTIVEVSTYDEDVATLWRSLLQRFADATQRRMEENHVGSGPPAAAAFCLVWMTERSLYQHFVQHAPVTRDDLVEALVAIWQGAVYGRG